MLAPHIVSDVECIANEVLILKKGQLIRQNTISALEQEIEGKVWLLEQTEHTSITRFDDLKISNMQRHGDQIALRMIAEEQPDSAAVAVKPNLEDVFLYYFGGDSV